MTNPKELEPVEIHFGDIFQVAEGYSSAHATFVVVRLKDNNSCIANRVSISETNEEYLNPLGRGTTGREHIGQITGRWDLERILAATEKGFTVCFSHVDRSHWKELWLALKKNQILESQKPPMLLLP